jgi:hypothetical protein
VLATGYYGAADFRCSGDVYASMAMGPHYYGGYGGLLYYSNYLAGAGDYLFSLEPAVADGNLLWDRPCPVDALPPALLGFTHLSYDVNREDAASSWYAQYSVTSSRDVYYYYDPHKGVGITMWNRPRQQNTVSWTAYYAP